MSNEKMSKRVQLTLSEEMDTQLKKLGDEMGIGKCGLIRVAIKFYFDYHQGLKSAAKLPEMLRTLKELSNNNIISNDNKTCVDSQMQQEIEIMIEHLQEKGKVHFETGNVNQAIEELGKRGYKVYFDSSNDYLVLDS